MSNFKVKLIGAGVGALLKSKEIQDMLNKEATAIKRRCGPGYEQDSHVGKTRVNVMVYPRTYQAKKDNKRNNTLLKAVHK
jgi:hypothetical protein